MRWVVVVLAACSDDLPDKPEAPDMTELVEAYATPTAPFDQPTGSALVGRIEDRVARLDVLDGLEYVWGLVDDGTGEPESSSGAARLGPSVHAIPVDGEGFVRLEHVCRGWEGAAAPDPANGMLSLVVGFTERGLDPVIFGDFVDCRETLRERRLFFAGGLRVYVGNGLQAGTVGDAPVLISLAADVDVDDEPLFDVEIDFQYCPSGADPAMCPPRLLEFLIELDDGRHLNFFLGTDRLSGGFRAENGLWRCRFVADVCFAECESEVTGEVVTVPELCFAEPSP